MGYDLTGFSIKGHRPQPVTPDVIRVDKFAQGGPIVIF